MKKSIIWAAAIIILIVIIVGLREETPTRPRSSASEQDLTAVETRAARACGPVVTNLTPNQTVRFPLIVRGTIDNTAGCSWSMFEGQAGTAELFFDYQNQGWKELSTSVIKVDDWTASSTVFSTVLDFNNGSIGIPYGTPFKIVFSMENASGDPSKAGTPVEFPVTF